MKLFMKKIILLVCLTVFFMGCKEDDEKQEPVYLITYNILKMDTNFWGFNLKDVMGFERHPLIENINFSEKPVYQLTKEIKCTLKNDQINVIYSSKHEESDKLIDEINEKGSTVDMLHNPDISEFAWLSGIKNGKIWIGQFNPSTKMQIKEWIFPDKLERNRSVHEGYGEYRNVQIKKIMPQNLYNIEDNFIITIGFKDNKKDYSIGHFLLSNDNIPEELSIPADLSINLIYKWYNNSFLIRQEKKYSIIGQDGKTITTFDYSTYPRDFSTFITPLSYSEYINFSYPSLRRINLEKDEQMWSTYVDELREIPSDAKVTQTIVSIKTDVIEYKVDILYYEGNTKTVRFTVDINNGDITIL